MYLIYVTLFREKIQKVREESTISQILACLDGKKNRYREQSSQLLSAAGATMQTLVEENIEKLVRNKRISILYHYCHKHN